MRVFDAMREYVMTCKPSDSLWYAAAIMRDLNIGSCPVVDETGILIGLITDRDIAIRAVADGVNPKSSKVGKFMTCAPFAIRPHMDVQDAAEMMAQHQVRRLPVVNQMGKVMGIISLGDLAVDVAEPEMVAEVIEGVSLPVRRESPTGLSYDTSGSGN